MANIAATDVTYTVLKQRRMHNSEKQNLVKLVFGDGALTYGAGGIPMTPAKMGMDAKVIDSMILVEKGLIGYNWMYNSATGKLVGWSTGAINVAEAELSTVAIAAQTLVFEVIGY